MSVDVPVGLKCFFGICELHELYQLLLFLFELSVEWVVVVLVYLLDLDCHLDLF